MLHDNDSASESSGADEPVLAERTPGEDEEAPAASASVQLTDLDVADLDLLESLESTGKPINSFQPGVSVCLAS